MEMLSLPEYSRFAFSLFAMLTPFAALPTFLSLTSGLISREKSRTAITAVRTAAVVLVIAAVSGEIILTALGASLESLRVGGGLVLLLTAMSMLKPLDELNRHDPDSTAASAIVPLGVPLLAGPGSISLVMVEMRQGAGIGHAVAVVTCVLATCGAAWAILRFAEPIGAWIGQSGLNVLSRLFGLVLAAMAIEIIGTGLRSLFPALG
jgi:multiple antibiotic resistance protein